MRGVRYKRPVIYDPRVDGPLGLRSLIRWSKNRVTPRSFFALVCIITLVVYGIIRVKEQIRRALRWLDPPPLYGEYHVAELALPQHDPNTAFVQGQKYLWVNNHVSGRCYSSSGHAHLLLMMIFAALGWGNYLEDLIMNAQIAYSSGRA